MTNYAGESPIWWRAFFAARRDPVHGANSLNAIMHSAVTHRGRHRAYIEYRAHLKRWPL